MSVAGSRVAVIGGSIAGCAAAIAARRAGCEVTVFERSHADLRDRGFGIAIPVPLRTELEARGYLDADMPTCRVSWLAWTVRDGELPGGRVMLRQPFAGVHNNWGVLWRTLARRVPEEVYRHDTVLAVRTDAGSVTMRTEDGRTRRYDLAIGADGYRSRVRDVVAPEAHLSYAGYVLWRGTYPHERMPDGAPEDLHRSSVFVVFPGGHGGFYLIPDRRPDRCLLNWVIYTAPPASLRRAGVRSLPPGTVDDGLRSYFDRIARAHLPPYWVEALRRTRIGEMSVQPIYDVTVPRYVSGRLALAGDAAALTRPHTGAGASKALEDARALERALLGHDDLDAALAEYDERRRPVGNALVDLGRRLGRDRVEQTPAWDRMTTTDFLAWVERTETYYLGHPDEGDLR